MKKLSFIIVCLCIFASTESFTQTHEKRNGFISTAGFSMGFFDKTSQLNAIIREHYPHYIDFNPILQTGFTLGFGYYFMNRFYVMTESYASSAPAVGVHDNQYSELRSYGSKLKIGYVFWRHKNFDFEFSTGIGGQYNSFLHTTKIDRSSNRPELALNSINTVMPIGFTWWIYKNGVASMGNNAVGISIDYNITLHKGVTTVTGFSDKTSFPNISSNLLWLGIVLKM